MELLASLTQQSQTIDQLSTELQQQKEVSATCAKMLTTYLLH